MPPAAFCFLIFFIYVLVFLSGIVHRPDPPTYAFHAAGITDAHLLRWRSHYFPQNSI
jgi:hypothetical protein